MATKKEAAQAPTEEGKKGKGKLIVLIVLLLLIAGGAGGGWYWWTHINNADPKDAEDAGKKKKKKNKNGKEVPVFVSLDPFTVNLQGEEGQLLQTVVALQLSDEEDATKLKQHMPLVKSRVVMLLSGKKPQDVLTIEGKNQLAREIMEQIKLPFSPTEPPLDVQSVLFTSFIVQ